GTLKPSIVADEEIGYGSLPLEKSLHRSIKKVGEDIENLRFHTAIASLMSFSNEAATVEKIPLRIAKTFTLLLSPFAPHIGEELWQRLGGVETLAYEPWPEFDPELAKLDTVTIAIQINGKLRETVEADAEIGKDELLALAKSQSKIQNQLEGKTILREVVV